MGNHIRDIIISALIGMLVTLAGVYFTYPKDLVTKDYLNNRMAVYEQSQNAIQAQVSATAKTVLKQSYELGRIEEKNHMQPSEDAGQ